MPNPHETSQELQTQAAAQDAAEELAPPVFREIGTTGLNRAGGVINEEYLRELAGLNGVRIFKEMSENDPIAAAMTFSLSRLIERLPWKIQQAEDAGPTDVMAYEFIDSAFNDMDVPFMNVLEDILSMVPYGWSFLEANYKLRQGPENQLDWCRSQYRDNKIGWKNFRIRSQDTLMRWIYDDKGNMLGLEQMDPNGGGLKPIPLAKALHFRTSTLKDNPEGRSLLRGAYRPWYFKKRIEEFEGIGVERDLAGLPVVEMPPEYFAANASAEIQGTRRVMEDLVKSVRNDTSAGVVMPVMYDEHGNKILGFSLMASPGQKAFDTNAIVKRKSEEMAMSILMDFLMLGHQGVGSFALGTAKIDLWTMSIEALATIIATTFNEFGIKRLLRMNRIVCEKPPVLVFGDVAQTDLPSLGEFVKNMIDAGVLTPGPALEQYVREAADLPPEEAAVLAEHVRPTQ